jgi:glutaminase
VESFVQRLNDLYDGETVTRRIDEYETLERPGGGDGKGLCFMTDECSIRMAFRAGALLRRRASASADLEQAMRRAYANVRGVTEGRNADYIPELAKVDSRLFGIAVMRVDGEIYEVGDTVKPFTIQSISKVFTLARALKDGGDVTLQKRIGVDPTGQAFNSIVALGFNKLQKRPPPGNPLVNAGAIATVGLVAGTDAQERWKNILGTLNAFAGRSLSVDEKVYKAETATNARNAAISWILKADEVLDGDPAEILDLYTRQCSVAVTARDLAAMGATLANGGVNPRTSERVVDGDVASRVLAVMATAGLYETTGTWLFRVGVPAKSGVGGGVLAVVPGRFAVAAFAPPLDDVGNSVRALKAIEAIVTSVDGNLFSARPAAQRTARK